MGNLISCTKPNTALTKKDIKMLTEKTSYDEASLKKLHKEFLKECPTGELDKVKFNQTMQLYKLCFPEGDSLNFCEHVFRTFDKDNNGFIDFKEFIEAVDVTSTGTVEDKLRWAFQMYDIDNNGSIEIDELTNIIEAIHQMIGKKWAKEKARKIFDAIDVNKDEKITVEEFIDACTKDDELRKALSPITNPNLEVDPNEEKENKLDSEKKYDQDSGKETDSGTETPEPEKAHDSGRDSIPEELVNEMVKSASEVQTAV